MQTVVVSCLAFYGDVESIGVVTTANNDVQLNNFDSKSVVAFPVDSTECTPA